MTPAVIEREMAVTGAAESDSSVLMRLVGQAATDQRFDADKLGKMLEIVRELKRDEAAAAFNEAMSLLQPKLPRIGKDGRVKYKDVDFRFATYENIDKAIRPLLAEFGFSLSFDTEFTDKGDVYVGTISHRMGHSKSSKMRLPADTSGGKNAIQAVGSSDKYARRYLTERLLNLVTEGQDDDGNGVGLIDQKQLNSLLDMKIAAEMDDRQTLAFLKLIGVERFEDINQAAFPIAYRALQGKVRAKTGGQK